MEKLASRASGLLGRTGKHLFLSDCDGEKPPLLLRMSSDYEDHKFISALQSFERCVAYANTHFDFTAKSATLSEVGNKWFDKLEKNIQSFRLKSTLVLAKPRQAKFQEKRLIEMIMAKYEVTSKTKELRESMVYIVGCCARRNAANSKV
ncbi:hypothetical protein CASFOL_021026 [Castilleja foliolosa]|uniref:DUF676 domain-containing protein n=1 Tax=Castilleja foliolosa TaxID=1961234 RepID=A0ABD3D3V5_9LAMI